MGVGCVRLLTDGGVDDEADGGVDDEVDGGVAAGTDRTLPDPRQQPASTAL